MTHLLNCIVVRSTRSMLIVKIAISCIRKLFAYAIESNIFVKLYERMKNIKEKKNRRIQFRSIKHTFR